VREKREEERERDALVSLAFAGRGTMGESERDIKPERLRVGV
jgi:hypothetical protein